LELSNQYLEEAATTKPPCEDCLVLQTTVHLGSELSIRIKRTQSNDTDRVAAIALQSWYELSRQAATVEERKRGMRKLVSFAKAYNERSQAFSLELIVVFCKFCHAIGHVHEAIELAFETIYEVLSLDYEQQPSIRTNPNELQELVQFVFDQLCYCNNRSSAGGLRRFYEPEWKPSHQYVWKTQEEANWTAVRQVANFIDNQPVHWPEECKSLLASCRTNLQGLIHQMEQHEKAQAGSAEDEIIPCWGRREASGRYEILPTFGWDGSYEQWRRQFLHLIGVYVFEPLVLSERKWENRQQSALALCMLWIFWKQKRRILQTSSNALRIALKPLQEILQALLPESNNQP
jgi:hypothetical protein